MVPWYSVVGLVVGAFIAGLWIGLNWALKDRTKPPESPS